MSSELQSDSQQNQTGERILLPTSGILLFLSILNLGNFPPLLEALGFRPGKFPFPFSGAGVTDPLQQLISSSVVLICVLCVITDVLIRMRCSTTSNEAQHIKRVNQFNYIATVVVIVLTVLVPQLAHAIIRLERSTLAFTHDGGCLYVEESSRFILAGKDPYVESYSGTSVETKFSQDPYWRGRSYRQILEHNPYLPGTFIITIPVMYLYDQLNLMFDQRFIYLIMLILILIWYPRLFSNSLKATALMLFLLNPAVSMYIVQGTTDIVIFLTLILYFRSLQKQNLFHASVFLGISSTVKQFAWFLVPFHMVYVMALLKGSGKHNIKKQMLKHAAIIGFVLALVFIPFLLHAPGAFIDDALLFNFALLKDRYPFGGTPGYGIANILLAFGVVPDVEHEFPMILFQFPSVIIGVLACLSIWKRPDIRFLCAGYTIMLLSYLFASRMFHFNYLGFFTTMFTMAYLMKSPSPNSFLILNKSVS